MYIFFKYVFDAIIAIILLLLLLLLVLYFPFFKFINIDDRHLLASTGSLKFTEANNHKGDEFHPCALKQ